jgi:hypothetical protein
MTGMFYKANKQGNSRGKDEWRISSIEKKNRRSLVQSFTIAP